MEKKIPPEDGRMLIYHVMRANETFEQTALILVRLIAKAQQDYPGQPRHLYLDIEGHRNEANRNFCSAR